MTARQIYTPGELAPVIQRSKTWIVERCQDGTLPAIRIGTRWLLKRSDLIRDGWLNTDNGSTVAGDKEAGLGETPAEGVRDAGAPSSS